MHNVSSLPAQHGTLISLFNIGLLIRGPSGCGKSELALGLIDRGHRLIADDFVEYEVKQGTIIGFPNPKGKGLIHIHGCGFSDIRELYSSKAWSQQSPINLILELNHEQRYESNPLDVEWTCEQLAEIEIPKIILPLPSPRNLPLICELLVHKFLHKSSLSAPLIEGPLDVQ